MRTLLVVALALAAIQGAPARAHEARGGRTLVAATEKPAKKDTGKKVEKKPEQPKKG